MKLSSRYFHLYLLMLILAFTQTLLGQTFRAGIAGTVQDTTGAVVANAKISLIGIETGSKRETISTSSGDYRFQDLPLEIYNVVAEAPGFSTTKIDKIGAAAAEKMRIATEAALVKHPAARTSVLLTSSEKGTGIAELRELILVLVAQQ